MNNFDLLSAFLIGVLGSGHCLGMCGGITSMLTTAVSSNSKSKWLLVFLYNFGRIASYSLIGAIIAFSGSFAAKTVGLPLSMLRLIAGVFLVLLGLYIGQWLMWLKHIESVGKKLWSMVSPLSKKLIPVKTPSQAFALGALWGWLPCGLVYSMLSWSLASGGIFYGAAIMTAFGLGTLPALISMSLGVIQVNKLLKNNKFKQLMAMLIIIYGFYSIYIAYLLLF